MTNPLENKPLAAAGLTSYRYPGRYGYVMLGATGTDDALNEANRSLSTEQAVAEKLEVWSTEFSRYIKANATYVLMLTTAKGDTVTCGEPDTEARIERFLEAHRGGITEQTGGHYYMSPIRQ